MTREEAITRLEMMFQECSFPQKRCKGDCCTCSMAISALSKVDTTENPKCDLISRTDAIEAVQKRLDSWVGYVFEDIRRGLYEAQDIIEALPSADAVHGEWIHDGQNFKGGIDWCHCSKCGHKTSANGLSIFRYCPNCGARMKGGAE